MLCPYPVGHLDYCRDCGPCFAGQGDCDNDAECDNGLACIQILGSDTCQYPTVQPSTGGQIYTLFIEEPEPGSFRLGENYEMVWENGKIIIIFDQLNAGDTVRMQF